MIESMAQIHMSEAEVAKNFSAVLEKVRQGLEVVVEDDHQPVAVLRPAAAPRRKISDVLALMPKNSDATMDANYAHDVEAAIEGHRSPLEPPEWD
jgi:antitoxin (DNA-binding transcriptional repressor) of toxin-antitoxin stability system